MKPVEADPFVQLCGRLERAASTVPDHLQRLHALPSSDSSHRRRATGRLDSCPSPLAGRSRGSRVRVTPFRYGFDSHVPHFQPSGMEGSTMNPVGAAIHIEAPRAHNRFDAINIFRLSGPYISRECGRRAGERVRLPLLQDNVMSHVLDKIEREVASEVLDVVVSEAMVLAPATQHQDECMAFIHAVLRRTHLRYGAMPLQNLDDQALSAFGPRGGLSATPLGVATSPPDSVA
jgi:hypothetical protein